MRFKIVQLAYKLELTPLGVRIRRKRPNFPHNFHFILIPDDAALLATVIIRSAVAGADFGFLTETSCLE